MPAESSKNFSKGLLRLGAQRTTERTLFGPEGLLSVASKGVVDSSVAISGAGAESADAQIDPGGDGLATYPLSAQEQAALDGRVATYGGRADNSTFYAAASRLPLGAKPKIFDASEGTPLDPLLNTKYDLNYPKIVPSLTASQ